MTSPHDHCSHPATKGARAACRKGNATPAPIYRGRLGSNDDDLTIRITAPPTIITRTAARRTRRPARMV